MRKIDISVILLPGRDLVDSSAPSGASASLQTLQSNQSINQSILSFSSCNTADIQCRLKFKWQWMKMNSGLIRVQTLYTRPTTSYNSVQRRGYSGIRLGLGQKLLKLSQNNGSHGRINISSQQYTAIWWGGGKRPKTLLMRTHPSWTRSNNAVLKCIWTILCLQFIEYRQQVD